MYKYKFNYALKGFAAYLLYREVQNFRYWNETAILTYPQMAQMGTSVAAKGGVLVVLCGLL